MSESKSVPPKDRDAALPSEAQADGHAGAHAGAQAGTRAGPLAGDAMSVLNARTARRQRMLLAGIAAAALTGASWFILGGDGKNKTDAGGATTIETAGLVNRDLSNREFVAVYGNRLDGVVRDQKALRGDIMPASDIQKQLEGPAPRCTGAGDRRQSRSACCGRPQA